MLEYVSLFVLIFTSLVGIFYIADKISQAIFIRPCRKKGVLVVPFHGKVINIEQVISYILKDNINKIIIWDMGLDNETKEILQKRIRNSNNIEVFDSDQLKNFFDDIYDCKEEI